MVSINFFLSKCDILDQTNARLTSETGHGIVTLRERDSTYLCDVKDGSIGGPDKYRSVVIDVYDCNDEVCSTPQRRTSLIRSHDCQVESFRRLEQTARAHQPSIGIQAECFYYMQRSDLWFLNYIFCLQFYSLHQILSSQTFLASLCAFYLNEGPTCCTILLRFPLHPNQWLWQWSQMSHWVHSQKRWCCMLALKSVADSHWHQGQSPGPDAHQHTDILSGWLKTQTMKHGFHCLWILVYQNEIPKM